MQGRWDFVHFCGIGQILSGYKIDVEVNQYIFWSLLLQVEPSSKIT